jgi:hypothetical protein
MKIAHNPHGSWERPSILVDRAYEAEVQRSTDNGERMYAQAQRRLDRAQLRLARAHAARPSAKKRHLADLAATVARRREELAAYERLLLAPPVSAADKQIRLRTGLDDHLELGLPQRATPATLPTQPVTITRGPRKRIRHQRRRQRLR